MAEKDSDPLEVNKQHLKQTKPESLGINTEKPKFPQYADSGKRIDSFKSWPTNVPIEPDRMTDAGFVYTGVGDNVRCYYCGGGLRDWGEGDDPWKEHAKSYPKCQYVVLVKGQNYIDCVAREEKRPEKKVHFVEISNVQPNCESGTVKEDDCTPKTVSVKEEKDEGKEFVYNRADNHARNTRNSTSPQSPGEHPNVQGSSEVRNDVYREADTDWDQGLSARYTAWNIAKFNQHKANETQSAISIQDEQKELLLLNPVAVQSCRENGYSTEQILPAIKSFQEQNKGSTEFKATDIVGIILQLEEEANNGAVGGIVEYLTNVCKECKEEAPEEMDKLQQKPHQENKKMKENLVCKICLKDVVSIMYLPCRHLVSCPTCAPAVCSKNAYST